MQANNKLGGGDVPMADGFQVYFRAGACDLKAAVRSLAGYGLKVQPREGYVTVGRRGSPAFDVRISSGPWVRAEAAEIGEGTPHAAAMRECDARFEVGVGDLDAALDEINTMMEVQWALQEACGGFLFLPWNGNLVGPEG